MYKRQSQVFMMRQWRKNESKWLIQLSRKNEGKKSSKLSWNQRLALFLLVLEQIFTTWQQKQNQCYSYRGFANLYRAHPCQEEAVAAGWKRLLSTIAEQAIIFSCMVKLILSFGCFICLLFGMSKNLLRGGLTATHIGGLMQQAVQN
jgi:hypothetical protein